MIVKGKLNKEVTNYEAILFKNNENSDNIRRKSKYNDNADYMPRWKEQ